MKIGQRKHGLFVGNRKMPPLYLIWVKYRQRCYNPNDKLFYRFGKKGIRMCKRWNSYSNFDEDMAPFYNKALKVYGKGNFFFARHNDLKDFCKENCLFINKKRHLIHLGERMAKKFVFYAGKKWTVSRMNKKFGRNAGGRLFNGVPEKYLFKKDLPFSIKNHTAKTIAIHNFYLNNTDKFNNLKDKKSKIMAYLFGGEMKSGGEAAKKFKLSKQRIYQIMDLAMNEVLLQIN